MNLGRIIVITGSPGTGKTTTASIVAKESDLEKSVHMHTDDFYHYLSKGAIPPHLPESNEQNLVVIEAFLEAAKRYARGAKLDRETNIELVETMWEQFSNLGIYESNVIDTTTHSISDTVSAVREMVASGLVLLF